TISALPAALPFYFCSFSLMYCVLSSDSSYDDLSVLSLHDALPIWRASLRSLADELDVSVTTVSNHLSNLEDDGVIRGYVPVVDRSEEHTSELQSRFELVCRLLLEKKKPRPHLQQQLQ